MPTKPASPTSQEPARWVQNPTLVVEHKPVVKFRVRGWGVREVDDPAMVAALLEGGDAVNPHVVETMLREGVFVERKDVPKDVAFTAPLSFGRPRLLPRSATSTLARGARKLNEHIHWQHSPKVPPAIRSRAWKLGPSERFPVLWVEDPSTRILFPWWPDERVRNCIERLQSGRLSPHQLDERQRTILTDAKVLVAPAMQDGEAFEASSSASKRALEENEYVVLRNLFSPLQLAHLRSYFRAMEREGYLSRSDSQVERRRSHYREPLSSAIHEQLVPLVSHVTSRRLRASYSFFSVYLPGAVLDKHKDRPQCEWNLSLIWDTRPEKDRANAWPIYLEVGGRARRVKLGMGDGLLYRGTEYFHWRNPQPARNFTAATFFHFVGEHFEGSLD